MSVAAWEGDWSWRPRAHWLGNYLAQDVPPQQARPERLFGAARAEQLSRPRHHVGRDIDKLPRERRKFFAGDRLDLDRAQFRLLAEFRVVHRVHEGLAQRGGAIRRDAGRREE